MKTYINNEEIKGVAIAGEEVLGVAKAGEIVYKKIEYTLLKTLIKLRRSLGITPGLRFTPDVDVRFVLTLVNNGNNNPIFSISNRTNLRFIMNVRFIRNEFIFAIYGNSTYRKTNLPIGEPIEFHYKNRKLYINGEEVCTFNIIDETLLGELIFYASANQDTPSEQKIHEVEIKSTNGDQHHFVPARRNADGKVGMLDKITGKFYTGANDLIFGFEEF